jgi:glycerol-3-phosphate acyltransferase PlsX
LDYDEDKEGAQMAEYVVAVDAMGGDNAPGEIVKGCLLATQSMPDVRILLTGTPSAVEPLLAGSQRIEFIPASEVIDPHEAPLLAVRKKADSSMVKAALLVKEGKAQAMVSAGSTGAVLACGILRIGRIQGIDRPALAPVLPGVKRPFLLIDCGANVDCQPEYLRQFGLMGSVYMEKVLGVKEPVVSLANIGSEPEKGSRLYKEAHELMKAQSAYRFGGNIEAREIPMGDADVVVADGFDGNLILKYTEGMGIALTTILKQEMLSSFRTKIGALFVKPALKAFKGRLDSEQYGGAPLLGVSGALIKAHGSSKASAIMNAVRQARQMVEGDVVRRIEQGLEHIAPEKA